VVLVENREERAGDLGGDESAILNYEF